ncbi:MAG: ribonuclease H-like YkuK family protein [Chitinophagales bacterium]|nr:ribonuclease H-like YkuK family protein [Chitinophagales bacterium]MDW8417908.1 ribonuclease H-like YkuK family protein [Chitinophagales bacterium]
MDSIVHSRWHRLDGSTVPLPISQAVENALIHEKELGNEIKVCIGTDSQVRGNETEFATVIVMLRKGKGGFMFINYYKTTQKLGLKERLLTEVSRSIEIAYHLCPLFDKYNTDLEVHADINTNPRFGSNTALSEAMGYILSMGFTFKAKPEAHAASCCANYVV